MKRIFLSVRIHKIDISCEVTIPITAELDKGFSELSGISDGRKLQFPRLCGAYDPYSF